MPRQARLDAPGVLQHVMARGIERRKIFWDDKGGNTNPMLRVDADPKSFSSSFTYRANTTKQGNASINDWLRCDI